MPPALDTHWNNWNMCGCLTGRTSQPILVEILGWEKLLLQWGESCTGRRGPIGRSLEHSVKTHHFACAQDAQDSLLNLGSSFSIPDGWLEGNVESLKRHILVTLLWPIYIFYLQVPSCECKTILGLIMSCEDSISRRAAALAEGQKNHIKERSRCAA